MYRIFLVSCNYNVKNLKKIIDNNKNIIGKDNNILYSIIDNCSLIEKTDFKSISNIIYMSLSKNIGKAKATNLLIDKLNEKYLIGDNDLIFSLDSDISLNNPNFFKVLHNCYKLFENNKISCIACYQVGNSLFKRDINFLNYKDEFNYFIPSEKFGYGIPGGGLITTYKNWKLVKGYSENRGIYGSNDGTFFLNASNITGYPICVIKELEIFHPFEDDIKYKEWKETAHKQQNKYGKCVEEKGFYD